jgi:hypothetical protein
MKKRETPKFFANEEAVKAFRAARFVEDPLLVGLNIEYVQESAKFSLQKR